MISEVKMDYRVAPSRLEGSVRIPGSKSHTIRALICALYADGESIIRHPLISADTLSARGMVELLGAEISDDGDSWRVRGGSISAPKEIIDVGNSGTALYFGIAAASIARTEISFNGDHQICRRSAGPLLDALSSMGVDVKSTEGCTPLSVCGPIKGGTASIHAVTSQYLSALLLAAPRAAGDTVIEVPLLNEKPYIEMTLRWLERCGIEYENDNFRRFRIPGGQMFKTFDVSIPADFSSAAFFLVGGAITGGPVTLEGLDYNDSQGDKRVAEILSDMGASVKINENSITVTGTLKRGGDYDLNEIPDALPILSIAGCFAPGKTVLGNVAHARIKETDRIAVMRSVIMALGGLSAEREDGLVIDYSPLLGGEIEGHGDHRIIMSGAIAGAASDRGVYIKKTDAVSVTFPGFADLLRRCGGILEEI